MRYTLAHKRAFLMVEKKLTKRNSLRGVLHDLDKLFLYPILGAKMTQRIHRSIAGHHRKRTAEDLQEAIIDWECARFTKPDKLLNARETLKKKYPEYEKRAEPIFEKLGL